MSDSFGKAFVDEWEEEEGLSEEDSDIDELPDDDDDEYASEDEEYEDDDDEEDLLEEEGEEVDDQAYFSEALDDDEDGDDGDFSWEEIEAEEDTRDGVFIPEGPPSDEDDDDDWADLGGGSEDSSDDLDPDDEKSLMELMDEPEEDEESGEDEEAVPSPASKRSKRASKKSKNTKSSGSKSGKKLKLSNLGAKKLYLALVGVIFSALVFVIDLPTKIPFIGKIFKPISNLLKKLLGIIRLFLPLILIGLLVLLLFGLKPGGDVELPDNGAVSVSSVKKDGTTITFDAKNDGEILVYGLPEATVKVRSINPLSWFSPDEIGKCTGEEFELNMDEEKNLSIKCEFSVPSGSSIDIQIN